MRILTCTSPGNFEYGMQEKPGLGTGKAIIKIKRIGICGTDLHAFEGTQPYFTYPRILGHELAGELVAFDNAPGFKEGEAVSFIPYFHCGICVACRKGKTNCCAQLQVSGVHVDGGMVEYLSVPAINLIHGEGLTYNELALVEPLAIGAHGVRRAAIQPGEFVLVMGAGPIGIGTMEFAIIAGAKLIVMDINQDRLNFCRNILQVHHLVDAGSPDVNGQLMEITNGDMPDVVIDATGSVAAINQGFSYMAHGGRYVLIGLQKGMISLSHPEFHKREGSLISSRNATRQDFGQVISMIRNKSINPALYITHRVAFDHVKAQFADWLNPANKVIKAIVEMD